VAERVVRELRDKTAELKTGGFRARRGAGWRPPMAPGTGASELDARGSRRWSNLGYKPMHARRAVDARRPLAAAGAKRELEAIIRESLGRIGR